VHSVFNEKNQAHEVDQPTSALRLLLDVLSRLAEGNAVNVTPTRAELTTQEAADILNVSRPHVVKSLESGALPFHKAGRHRRVRLADVMPFKAKRNDASANAMEELAEQARSSNSATSKGVTFHRKRTTRVGTALDRSRVWSL
jgi:excisionase family DNA binding protein